VGWETRERGGLYYTRSRREGGRVVREYVGSGPIAELIAEADQLKRERRIADQERGHAELVRLRALVAPLRELDEAAEVIARACLVAGGYRRRKGGWRMARE